MKLATMTVALMAAVVALAVGGNAFVAPAGIPAHAASQALAPAASQPAPSRSSGKAKRARENASRSLMWCPVVVRGKGAGSSGLFGVCVELGST